MSANDEPLIQLLETTCGIGSWQLDLRESSVTWSPTTYAIHEEDPGKEIRLEAGIHYYVPEHRPLIERCVKDAVENHKPYDVELQIQTAKGRIRWVRAVGQPVFEKGEVVALRGLFEDIDGRKRLEGQQQELLRRTLEGERIAQIGHWTWDTGRRSMTWTPGLFRLFGLPESGGVPSLDGLQQMVVPQDRPDFREMVEANIEASQPFACGFRIQRDDGHRHIRMEGFHQQMGDGSERLVGVAIDRTDAAHARERAEQLNKRLTLALDVAQIGVWEWRIESGEITWDERMRRLHGIQDPRFVPTMSTWEEQLHPEDRDRTLGSLQESVETVRRFTGRFRIRGNDGVTRVIQSVGDFVKDGSGKPVLMVGVNMDATELDRVQRDLERSNNELQEFAHRASHDLKAPLSSIHRYAEFMAVDARKGKLDAVVKGAELIAARAGKLQQLVAGMLSAARLDLQSAAAEPLDLRSILQEIADAHEQLAGEHGVSVRWSLDCPNPPVLPRARVQQVLTNLISNGIKYSSPEREDRFVEVRASSRPGMLTINVLDNGQGIPGADPNIAFEMFQRQHAEISGAGLGLYFVKKQVQTMGGTIQATSSPEGTRFLVALPIP